MAIRDTKIKYQLILLVIISTLIIVTIQFLYISRYTQNTEDQAFSYFNSITDQVSSDLDKKVQEMVNTTKILSFSYNIQRYLVSTDSYLRQLYINPAKDNMSFSIAANNSIDSILIMIYGTESSLFFGSAQKEYLCRDIFDEYGINENRKTRAFNTRVYYDRFSQGYYFAYVMPIYSVLEGYSSTEPIGTIITLCNVDVQSSLDSIERYPGFSLILADGDHVIAGNAPDDQDYLSLLQEQADGDGDHKVASPTGMLLVKAKTIAETSFKLYCMIPQADLTKNVRAVTSQSMFISVLGIMLLVILSSLIVYNVITPLNRVISEMGRVGTDNQARRISRYANNEVGIIADDINDMLEKIENMNTNILVTQQQLYEMELSQIQTELAMLYVQINPHFLYNSLDCIRSIALSCQQTDIVSMTVSLSRILRYSIKSENIVPLKAEIDLVSDYFNIINIRYMGIYRLEIAVDPELMSARVIKMILQPIVENSMNYGLRGKSADGLVRISAQAADAGKILVISIDDNGKGMDKAACDKINDMLASWQENRTSRDKIGLVNIQKRIKMTYGREYGLSVVSQENKGTCVSIRIPLNVDERSTQVQAK